MPCQYKNLFGEPGKGAHAHRFLGAPIVDLFLSFLLACYVTYSSSIPLVASIVMVLTGGEVMHRIFCVETPTGKWMNSL